MGHMAEAEDEIVNAYPIISEGIRGARLSYQNEEVDPDFLRIIEVILAHDSAVSHKILEQMGYKK
jgi:hypothetical protein